MDTMQLYLHILNLIIFLVAGGVHIHSYKRVTHCLAPKIVKRLGHDLMIAGMALTAFFVFLQIDWIINSRNEDVTNSVSWAWLLFDYALAVYLLVTGALVGVFADWKGKYRNVRPHNERKTDPKTGAHA